MGFDGWNFEAALGNESSRALLLSLAEGRRTGTGSLGSGDVPAMALALHHWILTQLDLVEADSDGRSPNPSQSPVAESACESDGCVANGVSPSRSGGQSRVAHSSPVSTAISATTQFSSIFAAVVLSRHVSIASASMVMCKLMKAAYSFWADERNPSPSALFPTRLHLVLFSRHLIDSLLNLVRGLGSDFVSEVIRFGKSIEECSDWSTAVDLQAGFDPWDFGVGDTLPHYGSSGIKSVEQLEEGVGSFGQTLKAENALRNERKDYFDEFSNLLRRFARVQGQDDSGEEFIRFLRTDFPSIVHEILAMHFRNIPWLAQLFLSRFLEAVQRNEESWGSQDEMRQTLGLGKNVDKDTFSKLSRRIEPTSSSSSTAPSSSSSFASPSRPSLPIPASASLGQQQQQQAAGQHAGAFRPSPSGGSFNPRVPYRNSAGGGRGRGDYGSTSPLPSPMTANGGRRGQSKLPEREDLPAVLAQLRTTFHPKLLVFALFLYEANNARFNAQCTTAVLSAIQQLSMGADAGMNTNSRQFLVPDLNRGQIATVLCQLRHLGRLLGFLHFHHLTPNSMERVEEEHSTASIAMFSVPLLPLIDEASRSGRLCWTLPWVCAFLRTVGSYCQTPPFMGYAEVIVHLRRLEIHWMGMGSHLSSHRLMKLMEIQSVWDVLPAAKLLAVPTSEAMPAVDMLSDGEQWPFRIGMLRSLSAELYQSLLALRRVHLSAKTVASAESKNEQAIVDMPPPGLAPPLPRPASPSSTSSTSSTPTPALSLFLSAPAVQAPVRRPKQRVATVFVELPESSAASSMSFNLAPLTLQPVAAGGQPSMTGASSFAQIATASTTASLPSSSSVSGLTSLALHSPESKRSVARSPSSIKAGSGKKRSATATLGTSSLGSALNGIHLAPSSSERQRAGSSCSSQASSHMPSSISGEKRRTRSTARQLFPDESKEVAELLEAAFWTQHSHLQRVHAFAYTHCHHACIAQIKEFVAVSLRGINAEVDGQDKAWLESLAASRAASEPSSSSEEWERTVADSWISYYSSRLQPQGGAMIGSLYSGALQHLCGLYSHYPDPPRVARLAIHYTTTRLRGQENMMLEHLNEYCERKIRELHEKKRKVLLVQAAQIRRDASRPPTAEKPLGLEAEAGGVDASVAQLEPSTPSIAKEYTLAYLPAKQTELEEACASLRSTITSLVRHGCVDVTAEEGASWTWSKVASGNPSVQVHWRVQLMLQSVLKMLAQLPVLLRGTGTALRVPWASISASEDEALPSIPHLVEVRNALSKLRGLVCDLPQALQAILSPCPSSEQFLGQARIEVGLFLITALPYLLALDTLPLPLNPFPSSSSNSVEEAPWLLTGQLVAVSLARELAGLRLLPLPSLCRLLTALRRDKTAAFYERAKGLPGSIAMIPEGALLVFAHVVVHGLSLAMDNPDELLMGWKECGLHTTLPSSKDMAGLLATAQSLLQECLRLNKWMG